MNTSPASYIKELLKAAKFADSFIERVLYFCFFKIGEAPMMEDRNVSNTIWTFWFTSFLKRYVGVKNSRSFSNDEHAEFLANIILAVIFDETVSGSNQVSGIPPEDLIAITMQIHSVDFAAQYFIIGQLYALCQKEGKEMKSFSIDDWYAIEKIVAKSTESEKEVTPAQVAQEIFSVLYAEKNVNETNPPKETTMNNESKHPFNATFDTCPNEVAYDHRWANGAGYFQLGTEGEFAPVLGNGENSTKTYAKSVSPKGRKILFFFDREGGNVVLFQRYPTEDSVIVANTTEAFRKKYEMFKGDVTEKEYSDFRTGNMDPYLHHWLKEVEDAPLVEEPLVVEEKTAEINASRDFNGESNYFSQEEANAFAKTNAEAPQLKKKEDAWRTFRTDENGDWERNPNGPLADLPEVPWYKRKAVIGGVAAAAVVAGVAGYFSFRN